jgi:glycosyltransferase involved in cell wall biosynthesis
MRVLNVIPSVAARYGGPSAAVVGMGRALLREGMAVQIATTDADGPTRLPVQHGTRVDWQGVPAVFFRREWSEAFKFSRPLARWLTAHVAEFDVVHIHAVFSHACLAAARACRQADVPYVVRPLGTLDPWSMQQKPLRKQVLWHFGVRRMLDRAAAIHYTTRSEQRLAESTLDLGRGIVIPLGVDESLFAFGSQAAATCAPYILVLGRLHPKKGIESLVEGFVKVAHSLPDWQLVIAGDGDPTYVASLRAFVTNVDLANRVVFSEWLDGRAKAEALANAALLALPSRQENFGLVVAEALACGTPVLISTHVNLADEIASANAGWVIPLDPRVLQDALEGILRNQAERERRGRAGHELAVSRFRWRAVARDLGALYRTLVEAA